MKIATAALVLFFAVSNSNTVQAHMPEHCASVAVKLAVSMQAMGEHAKRSNALASSWATQIQSSDPTVLRSLVIEILEFMEPFGALGQEQMKATGKFAECIAGN